MVDLTTLSAVKTQLGIGTDGTLNTTDDTLISLYVTQASQLIETETARTFSSTVQTLYYDVGYPVTDGRTLYFDQDWLGVDTVVNGANGTLAPSQFRLLPVHDTPKYGLQLLNSTSMYWQVGNDGYSQNAIQVNGTTGYCLTGTLPADITLAATKLAAWLYQHRDDSGDTVQIADGAIAIPAQAPKFVLRTISKYIRRVAYSEPSHR
jgi:hypothetical protein